MSEVNFAYFKKSAEYVAQRLNGFWPEIGLILGSGLGPIADKIEDPIVIPYKDIPNFLVSTAPDHAGKLVCGKLRGKRVICMSGRFHYYEGYEFEQLTAPVRLMHLLGVKKLILTNAAGGINQNFRPGDIMLITDHLKLTTSGSPMRGTNIPEFGPRFFDTTDMYTRAFWPLARECSKDLPVPLHEGVYAFMAGPQFETPAEIKALRILGADAVGMSTVTEALTAAHCGMPVLAFSLITNVAAGVDTPCSAEDVNETAGKAYSYFGAYMEKLIEKL